MSDVFTAACVQNTAERDVAPTMATLSDLIRRARDAGGDLIMTPEVCAMLEPRRKLAATKVELEESNAALAMFKDLAKETGAWILVGSMAVKLSDGDRFANRSFLVTPEGDVTAKYDKIHMFDVDVAEGESYRESKGYRPGDHATLAATPWGALGMTVCYDMRFPYLYRELAKAGADFLAAPSAFTVPTGRAHWHVLLRARAIENGCFMFAPAQVGEHAEGRKSYGHSLIVDPWGEVLADGGEDVGFVTAKIDVSKVAEARAKVPSLFNDREYASPVAIRRAQQVAAED
ncbi:MAG: carbon-nitrogen hydrolase family protein [Alphaproteobacteria bacterium]|jgi:deaminated glutathione amidase|nr:carbon-nitrogen hydrolase family protein [Alphaproteobacteria bacterium]